MFRNGSLAKCGSVWKLVLGLIPIGNGIYKFHSCAVEKLVNLGIGCVRALSDADLFLLNCTIQVCSHRDGD